MTAFHEAFHLAKLTVPIAIMGSGWILMKISDASIVGHLGADALETAAISDLYVNCFLYLLQGRVLAALVAQAIGAGNPRMAGAWFMVSLTVLLPIMIFVLVCTTLSGVVFPFLGIPQHLLSGIYIFTLISSAGIPPLTYFMQLSVFLAARKLTTVVSVVTALTFVLNLAIAIPAVHGTPFKQLLPLLGLPPFEGFGLYACPAATTAVTIFCALALQTLASRLRYFDDVWPEDSGNHVQLVDDDTEIDPMDGVELDAPLSNHVSTRPPPATLTPRATVTRKNGTWDALRVGFRSVTLERAGVFAKLYLPAALSSVNDYWRVAAVGAVAGSVDTETIAVFHVSYRVVWLALIAVSSLGSAISIRVGGYLGAGDHAAARRAATVGVTMTVLIASTAALCVILCGDITARLFVDDDSIVSRFSDSRVGIAAMVFGVTASVGFEKLLIALGKTRQVLVCGLIGSWVLHLPCVLLLVYLYRRDTSSVFIGAAVGNGALVALLATAASLTDWEAAAASARRKNEVIPAVELIIDPCDDCPAAPVDEGADVPVDPTVAPHSRS